jgi:hypothetical protein
MTWWTLIRCRAWLVLAGFFGALADAVASASRACAVRADRLLSSANSSPGFLKNKKE